MTENGNYRQPVSARELPSKPQWIDQAFISSNALNEIL